MPQTAHYKNKELRMERLSWQHLNHLAVIITFIKNCFPGQRICLIGLNQIVTPWHVHIIRNMTNYRLNWHNFDLKRKNYWNPDHPPTVIISHFLLSIQLILKVYLHVRHQLHQVRELAQQHVMSLALLSHMHISEFIFQTNNALQ